MKSGRECGEKTPNLLFSDFGRLFQIRDLILYLSAYKLGLKSRSKYDIKHFRVWFCPAFLIRLSLIAVIKTWSQRLMPPLHSGISLPRVSSPCLLIPGASRYCSTMCYKSAWITLVCDWWCNRSLHLCVMCFPAAFRVPVILNFHLLVSLDTPNIPFLAFIISCLSVIVSSFPVLRPLIMRSSSCLHHRSHTSKSQSLSPPLPIPPSPVFHCARSITFGFGGCTSTLSVPCHWRGYTQVLVRQWQGILRVLVCLGRPR